MGRSRDRFPVVSLGIFSVVPPTAPCALRSTQPLKVSTRDFSWGKGGRCFWLTNYHPCSAETLRKSGVLTYPEPLGPPRPVAGDLYFKDKPVSASPWKPLGEGKCSSTRSAPRCWMGWVMRFTPCRFYLSVFSHWIGGWVGPRTGLDALEKRSISCLCIESTHDFTDIQCFFTNNT